MATRYIPRRLESILRTPARKFPAVVLTGPRQAAFAVRLAHHERGEIRCRTYESEQ